MDSKIKLYSEMIFNISQFKFRMIFLFLFIVNFIISNFLNGDTYVSFFIVFCFVIIPLLIVIFIWNIIKLKKDKEKYNYLSKDHEIITFLSDSNNLLFLNKTVSKRIYSNNILFLILASSYLYIDLFNSKTVFFKNYFIIYSIIIVILLVLSTIKYSKDSKNDKKEIN